MGSLAISLMAFVCIFGGVLLQMPILPDKFARTLRRQKLRHKDVFYAEMPIRNALFNVIAQHRLESFAIRRYAIGPPILPEHGDVFDNQLAEPGEHRVHVVEDEAE